MGPFTVTSLKIPMYVVNLFLLEIILSYEGSLRKLELAQKK